MKKNRIAVLISLLAVSSLLALFLLFSAYQKMDELPVQTAGNREALQTISNMFYYMLISIAGIITAVVLLLKSYNSRHAADARRRAKSASQAGVLSKRINDILNGVNDPFFTLDREYNFLYLNSLAEKQMCAGKGSSLVGENFKEKCSSGAARDIISDKMDEVMKGRKPVSFEAKNCKGEWKYISIYPTSEGISVHSKDATDSKQVEEQLIKTQQLMNETNLVAMVGGWEIDMLAGTVSWTPVTYLIHEVDESVVPDLATGISYYKAGATRERITALVKHAIRTGEGWDAELQIITAKGNEKWIRTKGTTEFKDGQCVRVYGIFQDIGLKKQADDKLAAERNLLQTIIDNLPMNVYVKDRQCRKVLVNTKEKEYLQIEHAEELLGKDDYQLYPAAHARISVEEDMQVFKTGVPILSRETVSVKFNGTATHFLTSKIPYYDAQNNIEGLVGISYDITSIKEKEAALQQANSALEKVTKQLAIKNDELEQFASIASHDLQEPLRAITGFIALLDKKYSSSFDDKGRSYMSFVVDGAERMRQMIAAILRYSKHGLKDDDKEPVDIQQLLATIVDDNFSEAVNEGATIIYTSNLPVILADKISMQQLFTNLVGNALKYQQPGVKPLIKIAAEVRGDMWEFSVSDNGIGIKEEFYRKVFMMFRRLHTKAQFSGTGVGLAICKRIVDKYGGEIWINSVPGHGTTFHFTLPAVLQPVSAA